MRALFAIGMFGWLSVSGDFVGKAHVKAELGSFQMVVASRFAGLVKHMQGNIEAV